MAGVMAQLGLAYLDRLKKIKEDRVSIKKVVGGSTTNIHAPFPDQATPPPDSEKRKRKFKDKSKDEKKGKDKKESSSQPS